MGRERRTKGAAKSDRPHDEARPGARRDSDAASSRRRWLRHRQRDPLPAAAVVRVFRPAFGATQRERRAGSQVPFPRPASLFLGPTTRLSAVRANDSPLAIRLVPREVTSERSQRRTPHICAQLVVLGWGRIGIAVSPLRPPPPADWPPYHFGTRRRLRDLGARRGHEKAGL